MKTELALVLVPVVIEVNLLVTPMIEAEKICLSNKVLRSQTGPQSCHGPVIYSAIADSTVVV